MLQTLCSADGKRSCAMTLHPMCLSPGQHIAVPQLCQWLWKEGDMSVSCIQMTTNNVPVQQSCQHAQLIRKALTMPCEKSIYGPILSTSSKAAATSGSMPQLVQMNKLHTIPHLTKKCLLLDASTKERDAPASCCSDIHVAGCRQQCTSSGLYN